MSSDATGRDLLRIDAIRLGERVRKDLGDLQAGRKAKADAKAKPAAKAGGKAKGKKA